MSEDAGKDQDPFETMPAGAESPEPEKEEKKAAPKKKKPSDEEDWVTAEFKAAEVKDVKAAAAKQPAAPKPQAKAAAKPAAAGATPAASPAPTSGGGDSKPWNFLSKVGIENENTQKYVLFGGGGVILLCCLCSCIGIALSFASNSGGF